jgi:hypothetical protein
VLADLGADDPDGGFRERFCKLCGETFEIERRRGGQRKYCLRCEPEGWQVVKVPRQTRVKLRRRQSLFSVM